MQCISACKWLWVEPLMLSAALFTVILDVCYLVAYCLSLGSETALNMNLSGQGPHLIPGLIKRCRPNVLGSLMPQPFASD